MKKQILIIFVSLFLLTPCLQAQDFWEQLPFPDTLDISCVAVNNQGHIFAGTVTGGFCVSNGVYRSLDSGQTWQHVLNTGGSQIYSIGIDVTGHLYAGSAGFSIFWKSIDNGNSWQSLPFRPITRIDCFNSFGNDSLLLGCAKTLGALLLRTYDGGITFDTLFQTYNHTNESVSDIAIAPNGEIYIGLYGWFPDAGGLFKSADNGATWQCVGMQGYQVKNIEINSQGDAFIGARDMGTYAIYHDNPTEIKFLHGAVNEGLVLNSAGYIYINTQWPDGTLLSKDNGNLFSWVSIGTINGPNGQMYIDSENYLYGIFDSGLPNLYRSKEPTYTGINSNELVCDTQLIIYPNPVMDIITCRFLSHRIIGSIYKISVVNSNNQVVFQEDNALVSDSYILNVAKLTPGLYCLIIMKNQSIVTTKFVKI